VPPAGIRIGPYELLESLGAGGMGEVYRARDPRLDRDVAVKMLAPGRLESQAAIDRFEREGKALAALAHPNLLAIFDVGNDGGVPYLVTELLEGQTLRRRLSRSPISDADATEIAAAMAEGLAAAHGRGIVHRDLKPENVFLTDDGRVKILDFGIARRDPERSEPTRSATTITAVGEPETVLGTAGYMSPEQVSGQPVDARSDLFSLGTVLYEMLTDRRAFGGASNIEAFSAILKDEPAPMSDHHRRVPAALEAVTRRCLEKSPSRRFDSARDLAFALRSVPARATAPRRGVGVQRRLLLAAATAVAIAVGAFFVVRGRAGAPSLSSLAVVPFENVGSDPSTSYLSDGISSSLIDRFSRLPGLRVASWADVLRYKGKRVTVADAARELKVEAVLTGSVQEAGDRLTIAVELADARDGRHVWGERYVRNASEAPALEAEIAREIVDSLKYQISGADGVRLANQFTQSAEAYQLYLKGRYYWNEWDLEQARSYFEKAIARDPTYALAYAGLADTYAKLGHDSAVRPADAFPKARAAALEALRIDPALVEARVALAGVQQCYDWKVKEAEAQYKGAIKLQPDYVVAHRRYSGLLESQRRFPEAIAEMRRAQELEPFSGQNLQMTISLLIEAGRYDEAIEEGRKAEEIEPGSAKGIPVGILVQQRRYDDALAQTLKEGSSPDLDSSNPDTDSWVNFGFLYGATGRRKDAELVLQKLDKLSSRRYVPAVLRAVIYAGLGEKDRAFEWLNKALNDREPIALINADSRFDPLRSDPRFEGVLRRLGLR